MYDYFNCSICIFHIHKVFTYSQALLTIVYLYVYKPLKEPNTVELEILHLVLMTWVNLWRQTNVTFLLPQI